MARKRGNKSITQAGHSKVAAQHEYPRPMLVRDSWMSLNGDWEFAIDPKAQYLQPDSVQFDRTILIPFAPETPASGVNETGFYQAVWYRRTIKTPIVNENQRLILHFGAVDFQASVWVNDQLVVTHEGGYTPFHADITDAVGGASQLSIVVRAFDNPHDFTQPRGKQDWWEKPHSIWYYRTTGIWQTVWMEVVPAVRIESLRWTPDVKKCAVTLHARINDSINRYRIAVKLTAHGRTLAEDVALVENGEACITSSLGTTTFDNFGADLLWTPDRPNLIDAQIRLLDAEAEPVDAVTSYTALRSFAIRHNRFELNGWPTYLRLVLDQGYWEQSGLTAPSDDALKLDVQLVKEMGFNGVRKHQKIEDPRFLYWADRIGIFVWEEMPSAYRFSPQTVTRVTQTWTEAIQRDVSHPCIIAWVPFNESWGVPDLADSEQQRNFVRAMYHLTHSLDGSRPVIGNDGWELVIGDVLAIHDYDHDIERLRQRYDSDEASVANLLARERPGNRQLLLAGCDTHRGQPLALTEFGGIAFSKASNSWGYQRAADERQLSTRYGELFSLLRSLPIFSGFCYTQFTDTYQEANGLLYMDRTPKFDLEKMREMTSGIAAPVEKRTRKSASRKR